LVIKQALCPSYCQARSQARAETKREAADTGVPSSADEIGHGTTRAPEME